MKKLEGKVAVVAGATRGAGRGIARALGEQGATVYCTGRSVRGNLSAYGRPETIEETAELVTGIGGEGIAVRVDHTVDAEVRALFERVRTERGRLDILVNDVWGGDPLIEWGKPFWEIDLEQGFGLMRQAVFSHLITAKHAAPLMVPKRRGLIVEVTDGDTLTYRGTLFYDLVKSTVIRLAYIMAEELRKHRIAAIAVTPGFLRSEMMLAHFGVTEANWRDGIKKDKHFAISESPLMVGRGIAALAADSKVLDRTGDVTSSWELAHHYRLVDEDGTRPAWGDHFKKKIPANHFVKVAMRRAIEWQDRVLRRTRKYLA
jgi:NAD(P)-dependent dehydrogenase (short-subunit alcohol dehydrogenase family)